MKTKMLWKSMKAGMKSSYGNVEWKFGEWQTIDGNPVACESGFHASPRVIDAMHYVNLEVLALVEVRGKHVADKNKEAWSEMRIVKAYEWTKADSVALSIFAAELAIEIYEKQCPDDKRPRQAIEAAKAWLENPTKENGSAAKSAENAAWSAAWSAESAAENAKSAENAARSAAWSARSAANSADSAAWSAAWSAAESAWSAAWSAAENAAESAVWSAAWSAAFEEILTKCEKFIQNRIEKLKQYKGE